MHTVWNGNAHWTADGPTICSGLDLRRSTLPDTDFKTRASFLTPALRVAAGGPITGWASFRDAGESFQDEKGNAQNKTPVKLSLGRGSV